MSVHKVMETMMTMTIPSADVLKQQASRLRDHLAGKNIDISHADALEAVAKQYGCKNWNVLSAMAKREKPENWLAIGDRVQGSYLGNAFSGQVIKQNLCDMASARNYSIRFDEPVDVVKSEHFSGFRQQVSMTLNKEGRSVDHKGRPDNIAELYG
ncbi:glyoxalase superfamily protein [Emcibacter sp.]|uniref:glyoxalase superfamily protein n=1 Tax=Emcibacter sp. TaxID=1979954 RepID=UPI002AA8774F|nr:glyoxalase superfamily protein [Emcibacter sp.]